jgi:hypothetical protein
LEIVSVCGFMGVLRIEMMGYEKFENLGYEIFGIWEKREFVWILMVCCLRRKV